MTSPLGMQGLRSSAGAPHGSSCSRVEALLDAVPTCREDFLTALVPLLESDEFASCALAIRTAGESAAWYALSLPNHLKWLAENGFGREDSRQIRYRVEIAYADEPAQALIAAIAIRTMGATEPTQPSRIAVSPCPAHSFHRFIADWPAYQRKLARDMSISAMTGEYERAVRRVGDIARGFATKMDVSEVACAGDGSDIAQALEDRLNASCGVIVLASALRRMFIRAETTRRRSS